ncbi:unnamed protein product, partial [Sphacelaria rigidula]
VSGRWERYFSTLLNAILITIDRTIIGEIAQRPIALSLGGPPSQGETVYIERQSNRCKRYPCRNPDAWTQRGGVGHSYHFHGIASAVWTSGEVPQEWKDVTIKVLHKTQDRTQCSTYRGISLVAHTAKVLLKIVANRLDDFYVISEEQCGFRRQRSAIDMMFVVRRLQELGRASSIPINMCFIDLQKAYDSVDRTLLWEVLARFGVPSRMITIIRTFHDGMRARVQLDSANYQRGSTSARDSNKVAFRLRCCSTSSEQAWWK